MKKFKIVFFLLTLILISSAFVRFPVAEFGFRPFSTPHRNAAIMIDSLYPEIYDSSILISFPNTSYFDKDTSVNTYYRYSYLGILHPEDSSSYEYYWYWGGFNGNIPVVPPDELLDSLTASIGRDYSPFQITIGPSKEETIFVKIVSDSVVEAGPFRLFTFILQNKCIIYSAAYSPPGGYNWNAIMALPNGYGLKFTMAPNETLEFKLPFLYDADWDFYNLEVACFIDDSVTHEILQGTHGEMPIPLYLHSVYTVGQVSYLINPGDSAKFRIDIYNFGCSPDTFMVKSSLSSPAGWTTEFCVSETSSFTDSGFVLADTNNTEELSIYIKSDSLNPGIGTTEITLESQGGKTHTFYFSCASGGKVLLVDDAPSISGKYYRQVLDSLKADYFYFKRTDIFNMHNFDIVIWFTGSYNTSTLLEIDQDAIAHFLMAGGKVFISGAQIGTDLALDGSGTDVAFYQLYLGASGNPAKLLESSPIFQVKGVDGNVISKGLSFNITGGDGADNSLISNVITPYDAQPVFYYGESKMFCAGVGLEWGLNKVIYLPFCFEAIDNFGDRFTLMNRILNWFGYYPGFISEMAVEQPINLSIKSYPNPFNAICEIQYTVPNSGSLAFHDLSGRLLEEVSVSGTGKYIWKADNFSSGIYFVRLIQKNRSLSKKIILLK